jgi:hypothetical protein
LTLSLAGVMRAEITGTRRSWFPGMAASPHGRVHALRLMFRNIGTAVTPLACHAFENSSVVCYGSHLMIWGRMNRRIDAMVRRLQRLSMSAATGTVCLKTFSSGMRAVLETM